MSIPTQALEDAARAVQAYGGSPNNEAWLVLLTCLVDHVKEDLLHASVVYVPGLQAQARQLRALRNVVLSTTPTNGRA